MKYIDAHCHVQFPEYDHDRDAVIARMQEAEVGGVLVGTALSSSQAAVTLADGVNLFAAVGLHPNHAMEDSFDIDSFRALAEDPRVVAIGECGLDYYRPDEPEQAKEKQKEVFQAHIELAGTLGKPLMVHARPRKGSMDAYHDALDMLAAAQKNYPDLRANFHFFVGDVATALRISTLGFTCSYTAVITFAREYDAVIKSLPLSCILTETDSPYVAPAPNRGKRNEPTAVIAVSDAIASIRGEDPEMVRAELLKNATRMFGLTG